MASTLPTNVAVSTTGHPGLHNAVNAAVNEHDSRITSLEGRATALEGVATIVGAGRPDVAASMTTAVQAQVAAAPVGSTFSSTDGASVGAWAWQKLATGWVVTNGRTDWFDLTGLLANGWRATSVRIMRLTQSCVLELTDPVGTDATAPELLSKNLSGFGVSTAATAGGFPTVGPLLSNSDRTATVGMTFWSDGNTTQIRIMPFKTVNVPSGVRTITWPCNGPWPLTSPAS